MEAALCVLESKQVVGQPVNITSIKYTCFLAIVSCIRLFASQLFIRFDITLIFLLVTYLLIDSIDDPRSSSDHSFRFDKTSIQFSIQKSTKMKKIPSSFLPSLVVNAQAPRTYSLLTRRTRDLRHSRAE